MHLLTKTLAVATLLGAMATTVAAQTASSPAPGTTNPSTKVYAYKKTAPPSANSPSSTANPNQMTRDPDVPAYGSQKWWEDKNRYGNGDAGGN
jgi:hypothetical protein